MKINSPEQAQDEAYTGIHLFNESGAPLPLNQQHCRKIAGLVETHEDCRFRLVEIVFVDEDEILRINREHLDHDYVTDIITFPYHEAGDREHVEGTLYACAPRIREQGREHGQTEEAEFRRVIIHGLLHLAGYDDKDEEAQKRMRKREDFYLDLGLE